MQLTEFGGLVRSVRLSKNITQKDLAVAVGLSRATISALESGKIHELGYTRVYAIGAYLGLELGCKHAAARSASTSALLERLEKRYIWWRLPGVKPTLPRVIAQVMNLGTHEDMKALEAEVGRMCLREVLLSAEPGWFTPQSWAFWHIVLELAPFDAIPPEPRREHDLQARFQDAAGEPAKSLAAS